MTRRTPLATPRPLGPRRSGSRMSPYRFKTMLIEDRRDMSSAYADVTSVHRGMRTLNGRRQMLVQDEIVGAEEEIQWRMQ
jgi:hypothetical protein